MVDESPVQDYAAPATPERLPGKVKRNLHLYLLLGFAVLAAPAILWKASSDQARTQEAKKEKSTTATKETLNTPPSLAPIRSEIAAQTKNAADASGKTLEELKSPATVAQEGGTRLGQANGPGSPGAGNSGALPSAGSPGARGSTLPLPPSQFMPNSQVRSADEMAQQQRARDQEKEATRVASAAIIALTGDTESSGKSASAIPAVPDAMLAYNAALNAAKQSTTAQTIDPAKLAATIAGQQQPKTETKVDQDRAWANQQSQTKPPVIVYATAPLSPYMVFQGTIIPAVLLSEVNSDLPGMLTAQVTQDVYDGIRGTALLIPKGSRLVGNYNNDVRQGQERVMAAFTRLIFPSGTSADIAGMAGADELGRGGLAGDVDSHFWKQFGGSFLVAGLAALLPSNQNQITTSVSTGTQLGSSAGQILVETVRNIQSRNVNIPPTIRILSGYKFNILVNKDMVLPPPGA